MTTLQFRTIRARLLFAAAMLALGACSGPMSGSMSSSVALSAALSGAAEVPAVPGDGKGTLTGSYDKASHKLSWNVTYSGLSGPALAAHFHGPAAAGSNAGVVVPFASAASPIVGEATLTDAQAADLLAGMWYVNVHTAANKGGEIRGQVMVK